MSFAHLVGLRPERARDVFGTESGAVHTQLVKLAAEILRMATSVRAQIQWLVLRPADLAVCPRLAPRGLAIHVDRQSLLLRVKDRRHETPAIGLERDRRPERVPGGIRCIACLKVRAEIRGEIEVPAVFADEVAVAHACGWLHPE